MLRTLELHLVFTHKTILFLLRFSSLLLFLFSSILIICSHGYTTRSHTFIYASCSQEKYQPNNNNNSSPFESNLNSFLSSVVNSASQTSYNSFLVIGSIYGLYQCRGDLNPIDCTKCVQSSVNQIGLVCPYSLGASLQLEGCYIRYENFDFIGKLDTSIRYKKCNRNNDDVEFFRRRDDVLADLESDTNNKRGFRVSTSGFVEGYAECYGDLDASDCDSCIDEAVMKVKNLCGSAASGEVFLAQCYAKYWASGYYDEADSSNDEDQVGKSIAIIVGVIVGLAILVVLLSICRSKTYG